MQRAWLNGKRRTIIFVIASVFFAAVLIAADQLTKLYFTGVLKNGEKIEVIPKFFYFTYVLNDGAAYGILQGKRTLFLITTPIAVELFIVFYVYAYKKNYKALLVALALIICGAIGNFIDRAFMASVDYAVTDFICIEIAGNRIFGVFNVADVELSAGVVLVVIHLLFLDRNALFKGKKDKKTTEDKASVETEIKKSEDFSEKGMKEKSAGQTNDKNIVVESGDMTETVEVADKTATEAENGSDGANND